VVAVAAIYREPRKVVPLCIAVLFFLTIYISSSPGAGKVIVYPFLREIRKEYILFQARGFNVRESGDIRIFYRDTKKETVDMVEKNTLESLCTVLSDFDYSLRDRINIIIYPEYSEMANHVGLGTGSIAMGVYYGGTISVLEPEKWIDSGSNIVEVFDSEGPMIHEITHYVLDYMTRGNIPIWFTEGVALYEEYRVNGVEWAGGRHYEIYYTRKELEEGFYQLEETRAYRQSFLVVRYMAQEYGMEGIKSIIKELGSGKSMEQSVKKILGRDIDDIFSSGLNQG
jgi:hypothetical protein